MDAQDTAGNWFESVVRKVTDDTVTVHYAGWASRWDTTLRRRNSGLEVNGKAKVSFTKSYLHSIRLLSQKNMAYLFLTYTT